jgi:L-Ala-D/L-Glu epimerase
MKIKDIKVWKADLENTKPYTIAFKTVTEVFNAFVEITLDNGLTGIGSGNPSEYVTGENLSQCLQALSENNIQFLIGRDIREINQLNYEILQKLPANPAARAALDIALYDTFTKYLNIPLVKFLGQKIHSLPTSNTIGIKNVEETLKEAQEYGERGFKVLKVKLGKDLSEDIERIVKLRERFGNKFVIRIDANQGYTTAQTIEFYQKTKHLNLELIEQPLPAKAVNEMKQLPQEIRVKIAADESLLSPANALELVAPPVAAGIFNIKLMKCGGVS